MPKPKTKKAPAKKKPPAKKKATRKKSPEYSDSGSDYESSDYESSGYSDSGSDYASSRSPSPVKKKKAVGKKRALTDYQKYCAKERPKIKKDHPNMKPTSVMKELGKRWKTYKKK